MSRPRGLVLLLAPLAVLLAAPVAGAQDGDGAPTEVPTEGPTDAPTEVPTTAGDQTPVAGESPPDGEQVPGEGDAPVAEEDPVAECSNEVIQDEVQIVGVDTSSFPAVTVAVAVPPDFAGELGQENFALTENGDERSITVSRVDERLAVLLVIDTSGSMEGAPMESARAAARSFIEQVTEKADLGVLAFGDTVSVLSPLGGARDAALAAVDSLTAGGETALYDGLVGATAALGTDDAPKFIVVLSDGADTASQATVDDVTAGVREAGATLYAVTLQSPEADFAALEGISQAVDGQVLSAAGTAELADVYTELATRLNNQYRIRFTATAGDATDLSVSVYDPQRCITAFVTSSQSLPPLAGGADPATPGGDDGAGAAGAGSPALPSLGTTAPAIGGTEASGPSGLLAQPYMLWIGIGALFIPLAGLIYLALGKEPSRPSAFKRLDFKNVSSRRSGLASITDRAANVTDRLLEQRGGRSKLDNALEQAGKDMRPGEFVLISAGITLGVGVAGFFVLGLRGLAGGLLLGFLFSRRRLSRAKAKRQKLFANQLGDTLLMISGSIRAGHGVVEAIDSVAAQAESPTGEEFSRVVAETRIGRDLTDALYDVAGRTGSDDFVWVVRAIAINRELGGDLAEVLDNVGETIRDRNRLRDQVKALSAEGRVSAYILFALPILVAGWVRVSNPEYMASMTDQTVGKVIVGFAAMLMLIGGFWLKKLVAVKY